MAFLGKDESSGVAPSTQNITRTHEVQELSTLSFRDGDCYVDGGPWCVCPTLLLDERSSFVSVTL